jgi:Protein of unknown function (DUF2924)
MTLMIGAEVAGLRRLTARELRERFAELFGQPTHTGNKTWLIRRIAWRLQALAQGDLSERARRRAAELANDADLRVGPPESLRAPRATAGPVLSSQATPIGPERDGRLPPPGTVLTRPYKGQLLEVLIRSDGFEFDGRLFASLSAAAKAITGSHCNGFLFFFGTRRKGGNP